MQGTRTGEDRRQIRVFRMLMWGAGIAAAIAVLAGVILLVANPDEGSGGEAALGITAAVAGLVTAALAGAAAIYAQVKNLWRFVPTWGRIVAWIVIGAAVIYGWLQAS